VSVGKSTLAFIASQALGSDVIETESALQNDHANDGHERRQNLGSILSHHRRGKVIVIDSDRLADPESKFALEHFAHTAGPVIYVNRGRSTTLKYLETEGVVSDDDLRKIDSDWVATEMMLLDLCSFTFVNLPCASATPLNNGGSTVPPFAHRPWEENSSRPNTPGPSRQPQYAIGRLGSHLKSLERDFIRLLRFIYGVYTNHVAMAAFRTYLLSLTYTDISQAIPHIEELSIGVDCWELRIDMLAERGPSALAYQVSLLRRHSDLPIFLTLRTRSQTGTIPDIKDDPNVAKYQQVVLSLGLKLGIEYVDVNIVSPPETISSLVRNKGNSLIVISWHDLAGRVSWSGPEVRSIFDHACREGADVVMMIGFARDFQDNLSLRAFVQEIQSKHVPIIALNTGPEVSMSVEQVQAASSYWSSWQFSFVSGQDVSYSQSLPDARRTSCHAKTIGSRPGILFGDATGEKRSTDPRATETDPISESA